MHVSELQAEPFIKFVVARHTVFLNRAGGAAKPWTNDVILQSYRFCNVYRELDAVTGWIRANWRTPLRDAPDLWFAMVVARLVNKPETLQDLDPLPWKPAQFIKAIDSIMARGQQAFSGAYMVTTHGQPIRKSVFLAEHVLTPLWDARKNLRPLKHETLKDYHHRLTQNVGLGSFLAAQVIADLKQVPEQHLFRADDWWTWASPGPGSTRGMNRV